MHFIPFSRESQPDELAQANQQAKSPRAAPADLIPASSSPTSPARLHAARVALLIQTLRASSCPQLLEMELSLNDA